MAIDVFFWMQIIIIVIVFGLPGIMIIRQYHQPIRNGLRRVINGLRTTSPDREREQDMSERNRYRPSPSIGGSGKLKILIGIVGVIIAAVVISQAVVIVDAGHRGVVLTLGAVEPVVLGEGFHTITPFTQHVYQMEVRTARYEASASAATKDLQEVSTTITVQYHIDPSRANVIYQTLGETYADKIIAPAIQESVKASTARYDAENLITQRAVAKQTIDETLRNAMTGRDIIVEQVLITDFNFSPAFKAQIDAKVTAYQAYLTEQNNLLKASAVANQTVVKAAADAQANIATAEGQVRVSELAAQARIAQAKGDAEAIRLINDQLQNSPNYLQLQAIQTWNGQMPYFIGGDSEGGTIFSIPLGLPPTVPPPATPN